MDVSSVDFGGLHAAGRLTSLTVRELKSYLWHAGAPLAGTKQLLAAEVGAALDDGEIRMCMVSRRSLLMAAGTLSTGGGRSR